MNRLGRSCARDTGAELRVCVAVIFRFFCCGCHFVRNFFPIVVICSLRHCADAWLIIPCAVRGWWCANKWCAVFCLHNRASAVCCSVSSVFCHFVIVKVAAGGRTSGGFPGGAVAGFGQNLHCCGHRLRYCLHYSLQSAHGCLYQEPES